jgi:alpha-1,2-mannosyltransferase
MRSSPRYPLIKHSVRVRARSADYHAPLDVYSRLPALGRSQKEPQQLVCVGKEWYRFPSSFFLADK